MPPLSKALYPLLLVLLALFAAKPYWPGLRKEAGQFYEAWRLVRQEQKEDSPQPDGPSAPASNETTAAAAPRRTVPAPPLPEPASSSEAEAGQDPFLKESRRRAKDDPEAAMRWLQAQHSGSKRLRGMLEVVALWAAEDAESALLWLESNAQGLARMETLHNGVELWAARDPQAAAAWIDGMANDGSKAAAVKSLAAQWGEQAPGEAASWVAGLPTGPIRDEAARALVDSWVRTDPEAAAVWALTEAEFRGENKLLLETVTAYTRQSPAEAENFIRDMADAYDTDELLASHLAARAEQDPVATADWLGGLSENDPLYDPTHADTLMRAWAQSDSIAASAWLSEQPDGSVRDAAVVGFAESIQEFEPAAAAAWADTIADPDQRRQHLESSLRVWAARAPDEALEWVDTAELAPGLRDELADAIGDIAN